MMKVRQQCSDNGSRTFAVNFCQKARQKELPVTVSWPQVWTWSIAEPTVWQTPLAVKAPKGIAHGCLRRRGGGKC
jgi:hypothetical protein